MSAGCAPNGCRTGTHRSAKRQRGPRQTWRPQSETPRRQDLARSRFAAPQSVRARRYWAVAFVTLFVLAFLTFLSALLIRGNVLTTGFYLHSLDEARAFDRVYDDLLSDPEFTEAIEPFFGSIGINRSYAVSTLRFG